jgi:gliding motility-associated-like protein/uncharacterized repeat protein (TIGR01451 family)
MKFKFNNLLLFIFQCLTIFVSVEQAAAQVPFTCEGQVFLVFQEDDNLTEMGTNSSNNALIFSDINSMLGLNINALGFRKTDRLLYGIDPVNHFLYRIDAMGTIENLASLNLNAGETYVAGDITNDGKYLVAIGSSNGVASSIVKIDLEDNLYSTEFSGVSNNNMDIRDIAFAPANNLAYGYDGIGRQIVLIDIDDGSSIPLAILNAQNDIFGVYFDAFGNLFAYGSTIFGVINALFSINKTTGEETFLTTGAVFTLSDMASCPYAVEIKNGANTTSTFPCSEVEYTYSIANQSGQTLTNLTIEQQLPEGFTLIDIVDNPLGGIQDMTVAPAVLKLENITLPSGTFEIKVLTEIGDIPANEYNSQVTITNLPVALGSISLSDDPATVLFEDSTLVEVIRVDEDSIFTTNLLCAGDQLLLDGSAFGNDILWNTGATGGEIIVDNPGIYYFDAGNACQSIHVNYEVTVATCPFTIELGLYIDPPESLPCSEVIYRFYLDNDSGNERTNVGLLDTLPDGFSLIDVLSNPFGGQLKPDLPPNLIQMEGLTMPLGVDSIDFLVEIGDVNPGVYLNRGQLYNLPANIGMFRFSDNPFTQLVDSTAVEVFGTESDSIFITELICEGEELILDAMDFGINHLWFDGSTNTQYLVREPGNYDLVLFNGCEPTYVFYEVVAAPEIAVSIAEDEYLIFQSETIELALSIQNGDDSLSIQWTDLLDNSLSCEDCLTATAQPFFDTEYGVLVGNEFCTDSLTIVVEIDENRRIYAPNVFSPNGDGFNDIFYLQTPDFGVLHYLKIFDRWGSLIYETDEAVFNQSINGWDGGWRGQRQYEGVFVWEAEIEFIDGTRSVFAGSVAILK